MKESTYCDLHQQPFEDGGVCSVCEEIDGAPDSQPNNVFRLVTPTQERQAHGHKQMIAMLEKTLEEAKAGELHFLIMACRTSTGGVGVRFSVPIDEVQALGLCRAASIVIERRMVKE